VPRAHQVYRRSGGRKAARRLLVCLVAIAAVAVGAPSLAGQAAAAPPGVNASFTYAPASPLTGETVTFSSTSTVTGGNNEIVGVAWDLDGDGRYDDATTAVVSRAFAAPGNYVVGLRATDRHGTSSTVARPVAVGNRPPLASLVHSPASPAAGDTVTFVSTASDPDGTIAAQAWDLDGNGSFDEGTGTTAVHSFPEPGSYIVSLRVVDSGGLISAVSQTFIVRAGTAAASLTGRGAPALLSPFPIVRITGRVTRRGIRLRRMIVDAPGGSTVVVRCQGRHCPFHRQVRTAVSGRSARALARASRLIRVRRLERRLLRAGIVLRVSVTKPGTIGKHTRFRIRKGRPPARTDRCLMPGAPRPTRCPPS
jgi:PKD repeat protein